MPDFETCKERLQAMIEPDQQTWDLSPNDVQAIETVLFQIERQKAEIERLKARIADEQKRQETYDANDWKQD